MMFVQIDNEALPFIIKECKSKNQKPLQKLSAAALDSEL